MTRQEHIEEMAKIIDTTKKPCDCLCVSECISKHPDCKLQNRKEWSCIAYTKAEALYNAGYRKIPENAVVLTEEEYINLSRKYFGEQIGMARKETAKEFAEKLKEICVKKRTFIDIDDDEEEYYFDGAVTINEIDELLKQYGVEVEE